MSNPQRQWIQFPLDSNLSDTSWQCLNWIVSVVNASQPALFPLAAPSVTTIPHPSAVQVVWNEVPSALSYAIYESANSSTPAGVPFATVPANTGAASNSILRPNITDTTTRYYFVQAINQNQRSTLSVGTPGAALSSAAATVPVSQNPVNKNGVGGGVGGGGAIYGRWQRQLT